MGYLALSKYLPVYAIPHAAPRPWPREPVATSVKACFCRKRDPQLFKGPGKSISNTPPPAPQGLGFSGHGSQGSILTQSQ